MSKSRFIVAYSQLAIQLYGCLMVLFPTILSAQIGFKQYTTADGLPHDFTFRLHEDDQGYLWIGTDDGLAKFNGRDFKVFDSKDGFRSNFIIDIDRYAKDTLAISTWKGGLHLMTKDSVIVPDIENDSLERARDIYMIDKTPIIWTPYSIYNYYENKGGVQFIKKSFRFSLGQNNTLFLGNEASLNPNCEGKKVYDTLYFHQGMKLVKNTDKFKGIYRFDSLTKISSVFPFLKDLAIDDFGSYKSDLFYAFSDNKRYVFDHDGIIETQDYDVGDRVIYKYVNTTFAEVCLARNFQTGLDHIMLFDKRQNQWEDVIDRSKASLLVSDVFVDTEENIWITSKADGLYQLYPINAWQQPQKIIDREHILDIAVSKENKLFFITVNKIYEYDVQSQKTRKLILNQRVTQFAAHKLDSKVVPLHAIDPIKQKTINFFEHLIMRTQRVFYDDKGISFAYDHTCLTYKVKKNARPLEINLKKNGATIYINQLAIVENELWLATSEGLKVYELSTGNFLRDVSISENAISKNIKNIQYQKGKGVWFVTKEGLFLIDKNSELIPFGKDQGINGIRINDIYLDHLQQLWIATQKGFSIYSNGMCYNFGNNEGFDYSATTKITESENHQIFIAGSKGVWSLENHQPFEPITPPKLISSLLYSKLQELEKFHLDIIDFSEKNPIVEYKVDKTDKWMPLSGMSLSVQNYAIGNYEVQFRVRNSQSNWSYTEIFPFSKTLVWYKTLWATVLFYVLSILLIGALAILQIRKVKKRNKLLKTTITQSEILEKELGTVRENVAQDFHDELGNKLAGITVISEMMMKDEELQNSNAKQMAEQVRKDAKDLYFGMKDFVWAIDAKSDDLQELVVYLTDFGEDLFQNKGIVFKVQKELEDGVDKLPYYWSKQLLLLFKEAMTNSLKHANATEVNLIFSQKKNYLIIQFSDNGKGFDQENLKRKNGLLNMQKRADRIGGELVVTSKKGTKIKFKGVLE